jgi:transcriptional regulator with XRE-family HTH domain
MDKTRTLKDLRIAQGLAGVEVARRMGSVSPVVSDIENGRSDIRTSTMAKYLHAVGEYETAHLLETALKVPVAFRLEFTPGCPQCWVWSESGESVSSRDGRYLVSLPDGFKGSLYADRRYRHAVDTLEEAASLMATRYS